MDRFARRGGIRLQRSARVSDPFVTIGTAAGASFTDAGLQAERAYLYRVRARNSTGVSRYSDPDPATTVLFPDFPVVAGQTIIRADHITRLRAAVDAMSQAAGLVATQWSDDPLFAGTPIRSLHVTQMRARVDAARAALGLPVSPYTDSDLLLPGSVVRAVHFNELRSRVE